VGHPAGTIGLAISRPAGVSTRLVEKLTASLSVTELSKSQVSVMAAELDKLLGQFSSQPLDVSPYTFIWIDALTQTVREGGRAIDVHCLTAKIAC
jgi:putative transposase